MKNFICTMLTLLSIMETLCAQHQVRANIQSFGTASGNLERRFWIDMGKGNRLCLELEDAEDIVKFTNVDSLLMVFLSDMKPFNDSLSDPLSWHLIDYVVDGTGKKKVRLQTFHPTASSYLLDQPEPASLRLEQDTIQIVLEYPVSNGRNHDGIRQDRLSLYLNDYHQLSNYITGGLNEKMRWLRKNIKSYWVRDKKIWRMEKDPSITAPQPAGYIATAHDYLSSEIRFNLGNYKSYFAPSFALGVGLHFNGGESYRTFAFLWQPVFTFQTNTQGHLQTYRNDFLTVEIAREWKDQVPRFIYLSPSISFGWLVRREGDLFDKSSFRLFLGHTRLVRDNFILQPGMYFHDFFRGVTPAVNLRVDF